MASKFQTRTLAALRRAHFRSILKVDLHEAVIPALTGEDEDRAIREELAYQDYLRSLDPLGGVVFAPGGVQ